MVYGLRGPALIVRPRRAGDLPVLVHVVSLACAGSNDYAGPDSHSRITRLPYCLPPTRQGVGILNCDFSKLNHPAHQCLRSTLQVPPHDDTCKTRGQDGIATSFPVGLLHPLQHAGLSRRSSVCRQPGHYTRFGVTSGWAVTRPELRNLLIWHSIRASAKISQSKRNSVKLKPGDESLRILSREQNCA